MDPIPTPSVNKEVKPPAPNKGTELPKVNLANPASVKEEEQVNIKVPPQGALDKNTQAKGAGLNAGMPKPERNIKINLGAAHIPPGPAVSNQPAPKPSVPAAPTPSPKPPVSAPKPNYQPQTSKPAVSAPLPPKPANPAPVPNFGKKPENNPVMKQEPKLNPPVGRVSNGTIIGGQGNANVSSPGADASFNPYKLANNELQGPKGPLVEGNGKKLFLVVAALVIVGILAVGGYYLMNKNNSPAPIAVSPSPTPKPTVDPNLDSDGDEIPDVVEKAIGTNPDKMDSDKDGYNDLPEIKNGYSPVVAGGAGKLTPEQFQSLKDKIKAANEKFYDKEFSGSDLTAAQNKAKIASYKSTVSSIQAAITMCCDNSINTLLTTAGADICSPVVGVNLPLARHLEATGVIYSVVAQCNKSDPELKVIPDGLPVAACNAAANIKASGVTFPGGC